MKYMSEASLTQVFSEALILDSSPFSQENMASEFDYREGRTDFVLQNEEGDLVSFEMKLSRWRHALHQAYRNSSFAHYSYVVLPSTTARIALKQEREFLCRGIGLCVVENDLIRIEILAERVEPLRPWLTESALKYMTKKSKCQP